MMLPSLIELLFLISMICEVTIAIIKHQPQDSYRVPCPFYQSVNVTDAKRFPNGSYLYEGHLIPSKWIGIYDYVFQTSVSKVRVEPHIRACICKIRPCLNVCCPRGNTFHPITSTCVQDDPNDDQITALEWPNAINVTNPVTAQIQQILIDQHFTIVHFPPCIGMYTLKPDEYPEDTWLLYEVIINHSFSSLIFYLIN